MPGSLTDGGEWPTAPELPLSIQQEQKTLQNGKNGCPGQRLPCSWWQCNESNCAAKPPAGRNKEAPGRAVTVVQSLTSTVPPGQLNEHQGPCQRGGCLAGCRRGCFSGRLGPRSRVNGQTERRLHGAARWQPLRKAQEGACKSSTPGCLALVIADAVTWTRPGTVPTRSAAASCWGVQAHPEVNSMDIRDEGCGQQVVAGTAVSPTGPSSSTHAVH